MSFPFGVTFFDDIYARSFTHKEITTNNLADIVANTMAPKKDLLPLLKLGSFGNIPNPANHKSGCLRYDGNFHTATGCEGDYDLGEMPPEEAAARLNARGIVFILYSTASHTTAAPRWRILAPFLRPRKPAERAPNVSRLNGLLGGVLAQESWTLSTAFRYGSIIGLPPSLIIVGDGEEYIDECDDLDAIAQPYRAPTGQSGKGGTPDFDSMDVDELRDIIRSGEHGFRPAKYLIELWQDQEVPEADAISNLEGDFDQVPVAKRDAKWKQGRNRIPKWVKQGYARAAKRKVRPFSALVDHFENHATWKNSIRFNSFARCVEVVDPFPPQPGWAPGAAAYRALRDPNDVLEALIAVQANGFPKATKTGVFDALFVAASRHSIHPPRDYFNSLKWDGEKRLERFFLDYIPGAVPEKVENDPDDRNDRTLLYLSEIGICFMVSAVARVFRPGAKVDCLPILVSPQGYNKSKALASLVPDPTWFSDDCPINIGDKDAKQALDGKLIIELSEIPQLRREVEHSKAFFSRSTDRYRPPYARVPGDFPRQNVFIGSRNSLEFSDMTGNRRYWPVPLAAPVDDEAIARDRDQLWAEAVHLYRQGRQWCLSREVEAIAAEIQDEYVESDVRDEPIEDWIDLTFPKHPRRQQHLLSLGERKIRFTVREILKGALGFAIDPQDAKDTGGEFRPPIATAADEKRVIRRLRRLGYRPDPHRTREDGRQRWWVPIRS